MKAILVLITLSVITLVAVAASPITPPGKSSAPAPVVTYEPGGHTIAGPGLFEFSESDGEVFIFASISQNGYPPSNPCFTVTSLVGDIELAVYYTIGDPDTWSVGEGRTFSTCYTLAPSASLQCQVGAGDDGATCKAIWRIDQAPLGYVNGG